MMKEYLLEQAHIFENGLPIDPYTRWTDASFHRWTDAGLTGEHILGITRWCSNHEQLKVVSL